jgi:UDP-2,4-diacetamido-2,4,6-trideoxy-beta-L-altropyranose hydrolase
MDESRDLGLTQEKMKAMQVDMCIVDGYQFGEEYLTKLAGSGVWTCYMDDMINYHYNCHAVFNQNFHSPPELFLRAEFTDLILGPRFALLREEFLAYRSETRTIKQTAHRILVTMGGADPTGETEKVLSALEMLPATGLEARVIIGRTNSRAESIKLFCADDARKQRYVVRESISDMAKEMWEADLIISASGTTCMEFISLGTPGIVIVVVDNQNLIGPEIDKRGLAFNLGWHEDVTVNKIADNMDSMMKNYDIRLAMSKAQRKALDGFGAVRAVQAMLASKARYDRGERMGIVDLGEKLIHR